MKKINILFLFISSILLASCVKTIDSGVEKNNLLVLNYPLTASYNNAVSGLDYFSRGLFELGSNEWDTLYLQAQMQYALDKDVNVNIAFDDAALAAYNSNAANTTKYAAFPAAYYKIATPSATIPAGKTAVTLKIAIKSQEVSTAQTGYLLPISITGDPGIEMAQKFKTVYFHLEKGKPAYCTAAGGASGYILNLSTTGAAHNIANYTGSSYPASGYSMYTADSIKVSPSSTFTLKMTNSDQTQWSRISVYADWNNNGSFTNAGETILSLGGAAQNNSSTTMNVNANITVPATAVPGQSRLRVRIYDAWINNPGPCGSINFTTTQDFILYIGN